ncbi:MAG: phosphonoacetaldehyde reductase [Ichthyobacteriaceae bacterium]|nr:phosphonoacetaldehyde reductase [Ichthyobacteriaceae bacterium]
MNQNLIESSSAKDLLFQIKKLSTKKVFLVTGKKSFSTSDAESFISKLYSDVEFVRFSDFDSNPKYEDSLKGVELFQESNCDLIVAIGGGSVIDMAKLISAFTTEKSTDYIDILKGNIAKKNNTIPIIAIPTTSGTGSEATHFAVVYYKNKKYSLADYNLLPSVAFLNVDLILSQTQYLKACTGLDALAQGIESFWSVNSTKESLEYAKEAVSVLIENLRDSVFSDDKKLNSKIAYASYLSGKAINITKTTAPHALSYSISTRYNIPHGHAVFYTLPAFVEYNYLLNAEECNDSRGVEFVKNNIKILFDIIGVETVKEAKLYLENLTDLIGVDINFENIGIESVEMDAILANVNADRLKNNPRKFNAEIVKSILLR